MRNLKKVLSLVLALMMVLSVMVTASAADFTDAADIEYKEAVDVLVAAGVLNGRGDGTFGPDLVLDRAAAAKMVTYVKLNGNVPAATADALNNPFTDVPAGQWYTDPVKYCYSMGIIDGLGDGTFLPGGTLNGYAYAKMLLVAAGINGEYTGANWKLNIANAATKAGLLKGLENVVLSAGLTREQAAQMTVNALFASAQGNLVYVLKTANGDIEFTDLQEALLFKAAVGGELTTKSNTSGTLAANLKLDTKYYENEMGLNVHVWTIKDKVVTGEYIDDAYVTTYATGTSFATIAKDLGVTKTNNKVSAKWYANGECKDAALNVVAYLSSTAKSQCPVAVFADGVNSYKLLATVEYFATATVAKEAEKTGDNKGLYKVDFAIECGVPYTETVYAAEGTYVNNGKYLVVPQGDDATPNGLLSVVAADSKIVTVTGSGNGYVKAGNETYYFAPQYTGGKLALTKEYQLWLSSEGTVISANVPAGAPVDTTETLVYVTDHYSITTPAVPSELDKYGNPIPNTGSPAKTTVYAQGVDIDGNEVSYVVAAEDTSVEGKLVAVKYDTTNKVNYFVTATTATQLTLAEGKISVNGYYYNTASYTSVSGALDKLVVKAGNLKGAVNAGTAWVVFTTNPYNSNKTVTNVFYAETYVKPETVYSYAILAGTGDYAEMNNMVQKDKDGKDVNVTVYTHYVYLNGDKTVIKTYTESLTEGMYKYTTDDYGVCTLVAMEAEEGVYEGKITNVYGSYITGAGMNDYDITGVELVDLRVGDANDGKLEVGDEVVYYAVDTNYDKVVDITVIYIVG